MPVAPEPHSVGRHQLGPGVVGQRIVVRYLLPDGRATDVLGVCVSWGPSSLVVDQDGGGPVTIQVADVVTGKPVPPRASVRHRVSARDVELHGLGLWPDMERVDLGEWVLRSRPTEPPDRPRKRANSALVMGDAGMPLTHATNAVLSFYEERGQAPMVQVQAGSSYERWFTTTLGWGPVVGGDAHCQLAPVSRALRSCNRRLTELTGQRNSRPVGLTAGYIEEGSRITVEYGEASVIAHGEAALDGDWLGLHALVVDPAHRRQGLATQVIADLLDWGASQGATTAWLHVETDNEAAIRLYEGLDFVTHHTNRYLSG
jgi:N-acetylglutamate synthase